MISESVANRVSELEKEKKSLEKKIASEKMSKPTITKDMVVYWLLSFKNGSIDDESYQRRIIDTLVNSVFIYDDDDGTARLVLNFNTSSNNNVTIKVSDTTSLAIPTIKSLENTAFISVSRLFHCLIYVRILSENRSQSFPIVPKSGLPYALPFLNYIKKRGFYSSF